MATLTDAMQEIAGFYSDPLGFVRFAFPWGKEGTRLAHESGPDEWQSELLVELPFSLP